MQVAYADSDYLAGAKLWYMAPWKANSNNVVVVWLFSPLLAPGAATPVPSQWIFITFQNCTYRRTNIFGEGGVYIWIRTRGSRETKRIPQKQPIGLGLMNATAHPDGNPLFCCISLGSLQRMPSPSKLHWFIEHHRRPHITWIEVAYKIAFKEIAWILDATNLYGYAMSQPFKKKNLASFTC